MRTRSIGSVWRDTEGTALIEASILAPVLFALMLGTFEFAWYFHKQQLVESGVRDAARYLARTTADGSNPCSSTYVANAQNIAVTGVTSGGTARVSGWAAGSVTMSCSTFSNSSNYYQGGTTIYLVTASTSFADPSLGLFGALSLSVPNLTASHTERSLGPG